MEPETEQAQAGNLPAAQHGAWRIELREYPILHRGHAYFSLIDPSGNVAGELHGLARSRNTGEVRSVGMDGAQLIAPPDYRMSREATRKVADVAYGTHDEIVNGKWAQGQRAAQQITGRDLDYKGHDPSYEFGGNGGQIQNSNSANYTLGKAMDIDVGQAMQDAGVERRFSGFGRDLLDPNYKPYVAPSTFPVTNAP